MKVILGSDHAGFELKQNLKEFLSAQNFQVEDVGCFSNESCDYPDFAKAVAEKVLKENSAGILVCGAGIGMSIAANKVRGIRAANCYSIETAKLAREHNNANILCLGARLLEKQKAFEIAKAFLETEFSNEERHKKRTEKIE